MGCASSSPFVNGGGPGGIIENAKHAVDDVRNVGEKTMHGKN